MDREMKVFAGSSGQAFAKRMCSYMGIGLGNSEALSFSEGNTFVRIGETVRDKEIYLVQPIGLRPNDEFMELLFWLDAFKRASAHSVTAILPYFSYAKGDKKDEPRVSIRARVCAESMELAGADRVVTMDLHSPQVQGFFKKPVDNLFAFPVLCEAIKHLQPDNLVVVSPDTGYAKTAREFASYLDVGVAIGDKMRRGHDEKAEVLELIGDVANKNALIVDDFSISGGTLLDTARFLKQKGVRHIYACLSHVLLNEIGIQKLQDSPIEWLFTTDSVENGWAARCPKVKRLSVAPLFAEAVSRIHARSSVSDLFTRVPDKVYQSSIQTLCSEQPIETSGC